MNRILVVAGALSVFAVGAAQAQANTCPPGTTNAFGIPDNARASQDACQMAVDIFQLMAPQLGLALTGGNSTLGQGGSLGGLGHFAIDVRGNVFQGDIPDIGNFPTPSFQGEQQHTLPSVTHVIGLPTADAALGIFKGISLGVTNVLGLDALASATYVPTVTQNSFSITPQTNLKIGYGARLGLIQESLITPGVSVSYLKRDIPTTDMKGNSPNIDVTVTNTTVSTSAWRLVASKSLIIFGLAAGVGQDKYDASANVQATAKSALGNVTSSQIQMTQSLTRTNYFADVTLNLFLAKLVGEVGEVSGGTVNTFNTFSGGRPDKSRTYGSVGLRIGF